MLFNNTIKKEIKKKDIPNNEEREARTVEVSIERFLRHVLAFLLPEKPERKSKKKKIHKSDTETVFPPSNVPMDSLPGKARANSLKMHTFPPLYDLSFAITIHPFSNFERDNVRGNPVSPLT